MQSVAPQYLHTSPWLLFLWRRSRMPIGGGAAKAKPPVKGDLVLPGGDYEEIVYIVTKVGSSEPQPRERSVLQGCPISPRLFVWSLDDLMRKLRKRWRKRRW